MKRYTGQGDPLASCYYWRRGFTLSAASFMLDRQQRPYRRLAVTLLHAARGRVLLETGEDDRVEGGMLLVAPGTLRRRIVALDCDLTIIDLAVATPACNALLPLLEGHPVRVLDDGLPAALVDDFASLRRGTLPAEELPGLITRVIDALGGQLSPATGIDPRLQVVLDEIDVRPLNETGLEVLADRIHMSPSRLRHLFSEQMGCSLSRYLRWATVWKGIWLWSRGMSLAEVVEAVGLHDPAHLNRVFNEVFGLNPSTLFDPGQVSLHRCDSP